MKKIASLSIVAFPILFILSVVYGTSLTQGTAHTLAVLAAGGEPLPGAPAFKSVERVVCVIDTMGT